MKAEGLLSGSSIGHSSLLRRVGLVYRHATLFHGLEFLILLHEPAAAAAPGDEEIGGPAALDLVLGADLAAGAHLQQALETAAGQGVPPATLWRERAGLVSFTFIHVTRKCSRSV